MRLGGSCMSLNYDMCIDYDTLHILKDKLKKIDYDLNNSTKQMQIAIQNSQEFLSGNQFEKAKKTTLNCIELTEKTSSNITHAMEYIDKLMSALDEYDACRY